MKTFKELAKKWLLHHSLNVSATTAEMYISKIKQLNLIFGDYYINEITSDEIQTYLNELFRKGFSKSTIQKYKITLNQIFEFAILKEISDKNPISVVKTPRRAPTKKICGISDEEISIIIENKNKSEFSFYPFLLLFLGLRKSEGLALTWEDIDFSTKSVLINKAIRFIGNDPLSIAGLKNGEVERIVNIPSILFVELLARKSKGLIFKQYSNVDKPLTKSQFVKRWNRYLKDTQVSFTPHQLRHTYATHLYSAEVDIKTAQELLGHKNISVTLGIYTQLDRKLKHKNIKKLDEFLNDKFKKGETT